MSQVTLKGYTLKHHRGVITVEKDDNSFQFTPAEADDMRNIVNTALSMESLPALPPSIQNHRFRVKFTAEDTLVLERIDKDGIISFDWKSGDNLLGVIEEGKKIGINDLKLGVAGVSKVGYVDPTPDI